VHGFTSALSVLVPLPGELIATDGGFVALRLVSLAAFVVAVVYAHRIARELGLGFWPTAFVLAFLALDQNQIFFGMAGMETQIAVGVILAGIYYVLVEDFTKSGIWLGLALLARPDFVLWVVPALVYLVIRSRDGAARTWLAAVAVAAPWVIFTTLYYGSPVPHTVQAKSAFFGPDLPALFDPGGWLAFVGDSLGAAAHDWKLVAPFFERLFVFDTPLPYTLLKLIAYAVLLLALVGAVATWRRPSWRPAIAYAALFVLYKVFIVGIGYGDWYGPPAIAVIILLTAARPGLAAVPAVALAIAYACHIPLSFPLEAEIQHEIEDQVRVPLGRYIGEVTRPGETMTSESSGYVAYHTNATLYDFPGLTSPTAVATLESGIPHLPGTYGITQLRRPDWLILRQGEVEYLREADPQTASEYEVVRRFRVSDEDTFLDQGGLVLLNFDRDFSLLRRVGP